MAIYLSILFLTRDKYGFGPVTVMYLVVPGLYITAAVVYFGDV
jgi:hypothetical protein